MLLSSFNRSPVGIVLILFLLTTLPCTLMVKSVDGEVWHAVDLPNTSYPTGRVSSEGPGIAHRAEAVGSIKSSPGHIVTWSDTLPTVDTASVQPTLDGGYLVAGSQITKLNSAGEQEWSRSYMPLGYFRSGLGADRAQTRDGGYILAGAAVSNDYVSQVDAWLLKLDQNGNVEWSKTYGGPKGDIFYTVEQTPDGGYIAIGNTELVGGHLSNGWIVKLDSEGNVVWDEAFVGEDLHSISLTKDGGFLVSGAVGLPSNSVAVWVLKMSGSGQVTWQMGYDPVNGKYPIHIRWTSNQQLSNGGYIVSADVLRSGYFDSPAPPEKLFLRLDEAGKIVWQKWYSVEPGLAPYSYIEETHDHGFIVAGSSSLSSPPGTIGPWLLKLSSDGDILWQRLYGTSYLEYFEQARETKDNGFVIAGRLIDHNSGWVLKTDSKGKVVTCQSFDITSNATIVDSNATVTSTKLTGVPTVSAVALSTDVSSTSSPVSLTNVQCTPSTMKAHYDSQFQDSHRGKWWWRVQYGRAHRFDALTLDRTESTFSQAVFNPAVT